VNFKRRGNCISLYRSVWVPKGPDVPHGYTRQYYVGSIRADATSLPPELSHMLSHDECVLLERKVLRPARYAQEEELQYAKARETDPIWRLEEALRLINEAAARSQANAVVASHVQLLKTAADKVKTIGAAAVTPPPPSDPLRDALMAIEAAAEAVRQGRYGRAPSNGFRKTAVFKQWTKILAGINGDERSLLRALQAVGFATRRKR